MSSECGENNELKADEKYDNSIIYFNITIYQNNVL